MEAEVGVAGLARPVEHGEPSDGGEDGLFAGLADDLADLLGVWVDIVLIQDAVENLTDADAVFLAGLESLGDDGEDLEAM